MITENFKVSWKHVNNIGRLRLTTIVRSKETGILGVVGAALPKNRYIVSYVGVEGVVEEKFANLSVVKAPKSKEKSKTFCMIQSKDGVDTISNGISILNPEDKNYNRKKGMKESFSDATSRLNREQKEELWNGFKAMSPKCLNC